MKTPDERPWPKTAEGRAIVDDYYSTSDAREGVGYSLGERIAKVEAQVLARAAETVEGLPDPRTYETDYSVEPSYWIGVEEFRRAVLATLRPQANKEILR